MEVLVQGSTNWPRAEDPREEHLGKEDTEIQQTLRKCGACKTSKTVDLINITYSFNIQTDRRQYDYKHSMNG